LRFSGVLPGIWSFETQSDVPELDNIRGHIRITPDEQAPGHVSHIGNRWVRTGLQKGFCPQLVMYGSPLYISEHLDDIDRDIKLFLGKHGFTGFHVRVGCRWFDIKKPSCRLSLIDQLLNRPINPDIRTFIALEHFIQRVYQAGGHVHLWMWGDEERKQTPISYGGLNGKVDRRLQRYIAARLGPLPGWTLGYGFDLHEWVVRDDLAAWHSYFSRHLGWPHLLGARNHRQSFQQIYPGLDYYSYEQHRPDYNTYAKTIGMSLHKPAFSEDRFRMGRSGWEYKDYNETMIRKGLWHSSISGGVANIWGNLTDSNCANTGDCPSSPFNHPEWIKTNSLFFNRYFKHEFFKDVSFFNADTMVLHDPNFSKYMYYIENASMADLNLPKLEGEKNAVAVDTTQVYKEIPIGVAIQGMNTFKFPHQSDWAVAIGFE
jgi:hypothetical protein